MTHIESFKVSVQKISTLLDDRHPGINAWNALLSEAAKEFQRAASAINAVGTASPGVSDLSLNELNTEIKTVERLLAAPEPGLLAWQTALRRSVQRASSLFLTAGVDFH
ncbi:MAG: hypothetical protein LRY54_00190 [Alphaproteobacteria bacterium]|nr:hypothetical protein [Alphaproteobacteria bacterium]